MPDNAGRPLTRVFDSWSDERASALRSSAADIKRRAVALGQWRTALDCSYFTWSPSPTA